MTQEYLLELIQVLKEQKQVYTKLKKTLTSQYKQIIDNKVNNLKQTTKTIATLTQEVKITEDKRQQLAQQLSSLYGLDKNLSVRELIPLIKNTELKEVIGVITKQLYDLIKEVEEINHRNTYLLKYMMDLAQESLHFLSQAVNGGNGYTFGSKKEPLVENTTPMVLNQTV